MVKLHKLNHVTYLTNNIPATIEFYTEVLGMRLVAAERRAIRASDLTTAPGTALDAVNEGGLDEQLTIMFEMLDGSRIAFAEVAGLTEWPTNPLPRWIKHMAMRVESLEELQQAKASLVAKGLNLLGPVDHGLFHSIYFFDPVNDVRLEYAYNVHELDESDSRAAWEALEVWKAGGVPGNKSIH